MLTIKLVDGSTHTFKDSEFDSYEIKDNFIIVEKGETHVGLFNRDQFMCLIFRQSEHEL